MKILSTFLLLLFSFSSFSQEVRPFTIGEVLTFESETLAEKRSLNIYLPHGYSQDSSKTYPVIYLLDGSEDEDFVHISGLVQFASFSWINLIPESIVVGIVNVDRKRDFTFPTSNLQDLKNFPTTGGSENFIQYIEKEVLPLIQKTYKTSTSQTIIGQSLGGLLATEILFKNPYLFNNYVIVSPSLWWNDQSILSFKPFSNTEVKSIYISVAKEGPLMKKLAKKLYRKVKVRSSENTKVYFDYFPHQNHGDALHQSVYNAFEKLSKE